MENTKNREEEITSLLEKYEAAHKLARKMGFQDIVKFFYFLSEEHSSDFNHYAKIAFKTKKAIEDLKKGNERNECYFDYFRAIINADKYLLEYKNREEGQLLSIPKKDGDKRREGQVEKNFKEGIVSNRQLKQQEQRVGRDSYDRPRREYSDRPRRDGDRPRPYGDRPQRDGDRPRQYSDRPRREGENSDRPKRSFDGPRREYNSDRTRRSYGDRPQADKRTARSQRSFSDTPRRTSEN